MEDSKAVEKIIVERCEKLRGKEESWESGLKWNGGEEKRERE